MQGCSVIAHTAFGKAQQSQENKMKGRKTFLFGFSYLLFQFLIFSSLPPFCSHLYTLPSWPLHLWVISFNQKHSLLPFMFPVLSELFKSVSTQVGETYDGEERKPTLTR